MKLFQRTPMFFIFTAISITGSAFYSIFKAFENYGKPLSAYADPLWFYIFMFLFITVKTSLIWVTITNITYYVIKRLIQIVFNLIF
ncbi:hypothetical protein [Bacillus solimangrovi]|uniref:Uncharacterized protein n=1 Tax=Bacillus solimangrovi TaxID=1305675 RepID=A0A1E5LJ16_9BACI|nr:hypothetical protein [Bacillus solimangrovi]OEH94089.1 hypothetical protein BFG57_09590 [Bacillus solimangrovi]